ncbi:OprO/OprP family phosphate-selective porin [Colwellia sp. BRX10-3]|uniref:OprO/OprP family phosphate-selective porin n=1 Tax=Colwellia sp. BRX10-3 TaxID=2759844 RepID=UPI0021751091|nr:OprO/OprP family phosphate-selective porin [Colwellia sp. BRX10-3]
MKNFQFFPPRLSAGTPDSLAIFLPAKVSAALILSGAFSTLSFAQTPSLSNLTVSAVLDGYYQSEDRLMTERAEGFGLGETELAFSASIDDMFFGKLTTVFESHNGESEVNIEEAFIQTMALPNGFTVRAGRFLSDIGYLNNQHLHSDAFTSRPSAYRAFLGGHYFDDGLRVSYIAPTDLYWTMGAEIFAGESLRAADETGEREFDSTGVYTAFTKIGGDLNIESSWQLGVSYLRNANGQLTPEAHEEEAGEDAHAHSASYTGKNTFVTDFVYKWAPNGNYKYQHLTLSAEYFRVSDFMVPELHEAFAEEEHDEEENSAKDYHQAWYVSGVYQFSPNWSAGLRYGQLDSQLQHEEHFDQQTLKETEFSVAWHNSHFSTVRVEFSHQSNIGFENAENDNVITLQYVMAMGAHNAHQF